MVAIAYVNIFFVGFYAISVFALLKKKKVFAFVKGVNWKFILGIDITSKV